MTIDERRQRLRRKLEEVLGPEEARTLMEDLGGQRLTPDDLRRELETLEGRIDTRMDLKVQLLEERMDRKLAELQSDLLGVKSDLLQGMNEQTKTLFRTFIVSNSATVLAVATLAFGAARLA